MQQFSTWDKRYRYIFMVLDVFSKYGWMVALKAKKGETVTEAFKGVSKKVENRCIFGSTRERSFITNI